jgi:beta-glucosidase
MQFTFKSWLVRIMAFALILLLTTPALMQDDTPLYKDPTQLVEARVEDLLARMSLDEKIGQMTQVEKNSIKDEDDIAGYYLGSILSGGGGSPDRNTPESWADMVNGYQEIALTTPLGIPLIYGVDAVHGHNNVRGATIFPQQIGLGAANDLELMQQIGQITAKEMIATGIYWNFSPVVAVAQDIRWGRIYESYSENTELVTELALAYLRGMQGDSLDDPFTVIGTPKHFVGDGGTAWDSSTTNDYLLDQGVTDVDEATLRAVHLPPYQAAVESGARSIMASFSSWGGMKMHAQQYLLTDVLKGELGFTGFLVSDWAGMDQITNNYYNAMVTGINAGVDMNMVPYDYYRFIDTMFEAVDKGDISVERIDDAVRRILRVKFELGLFENPFGDDSLLAEVGSEEHRAVARQAVSESLVLLKNENAALPIAKDTPTIFVGGAFADDIGVQSGGWTMTWQGTAGGITPGTTILQGIEAAVSLDTSVHFDRFGRFEDVTDDAGSPVIADVGIVIVGEDPYAEGVGDATDLHLPEPQRNLIDRMRQQSQTLIIILVSGRPMIITDQLESADAFVAAWLPGTEGAGVADVLFGDKPFTGKLSFTWPRSMDQIPLANVGDDPLFPFGYGLTTE